MASVLGTLHPTDGVFLLSIDRGPYRNTPRVYNTLEQLPLRSTPLVIAFDFLKMVK